MSNVIEKPKQQLTLRDQLQTEGMKKHLAMALPKHLTPDRMVRVALTALTRMPKLADCDQASFFKALFECSQMGLEPDGRRAHLIPFDKKNKVGNDWIVEKTECQLIVDYKGLTELAFRSGRVKSIHAQEVRRGDLFEFDLGQVTKHVPHFLRTDANKPPAAGEVFAFYCVVEMTGNAYKCEVMSIDEVNAIRDKSQGYQAYLRNVKKYPNSTSVWVEYPIEMGKKTVFKRASKWLPLSSEIVLAMKHDDDGAIVDSDTVVTRQSIEEITNLLDDQVPLLGEDVLAEGEILPYDENIIRTRFAGCMKREDVVSLERELTDAHPEQELPIAAMAADRKEELKSRKPDGKLPMGG